LVVAAILLFPRYGDNRAELKKNMQDDIQVAVERYYKDYCNQDISVPSVRIYLSMMTGYNWEVNLSASQNIYGSVGSEVIDLIPPQGCQQGIFILDRNAKRFVQANSLPYASTKSAFPSDFDLFVRYLPKFVIYVILLVTSIYFWVKMRRKEKQN